MSNEIELFYNEFKSFLSQCSYKNCYKLHNLKTIEDTISECILYHDNKKSIKNKVDSNYIKLQIKSNRAIEIYNWNPLLLKSYYESILLKDNTASVLFKILKQYIKSFNRFKTVILTSKYNEFFSALYNLERITNTQEDYQDTFILNADSTIKAINYFNLIHCTDYNITLDGIEVFPEKLESIQKNLERKISTANPFKVLNKIFNILKSSCYKASTQRYDFVAYKNESMNHANLEHELPIPFKYILNLCCKNLPNTPQNANGYTNCESIFDDARNILALTQCFEFNEFSDIVINNLQELPLHILKQIQKDVMIQPVQYYPEFILELINFLLIPETQKEIYSKLTLLLKSNRLLDLIKVILEKPSNSIIRETELITETKFLNISRTTIDNFLTTFSIKKENVNTEYQSPFDKTNLFKFPLIKLNSNDYYLLHPLFTSNAFYQIIYDSIYNAIPSKEKRNFANYYGKKIENYAKFVFDKKSYKTFTGFIEKDHECDIILETDYSINFIEVKKKELIYEFELTNDKKVLEEMANNGLLKAAYQAINHCLLLESHQNVELYSDIKQTDKICDISLNNRNLTPVAIGGSEYLFFNLNLCALYLLRSMFHCSYHATDNQDNTVEKLNQLCDKYRDLLTKYPNYDINKIINNISFKSLQQLWYTLKLSPDKEHFFMALTNGNRIIDKYDYYTSCCKILNTKYQ